MTKKMIVSIAIICLIIASAFVLNPSPEKHRQKIRETIAERSPLAGALGFGAISAFMSTYHQLGVASYTTVNGRTISIGAFGAVFVLEQQDRE